MHVHVHVHVHALCFGGVLHRCDCFMPALLSVVYPRPFSVLTLRFDIDVIDDIDDMVARTRAPVDFRTADNLADLANPSYVGEPPYTGAWKDCAYDPDKPPQAAPGGLYSTDQVKVDVSLVEVVRAWSKDVIRGGLTDEAAIVAFSRDWFRQRAEQGVVAPSQSSGGEEALLLKAEEQRKREAAAKAAAVAEAAAVAAAAAEAAAVAEAAAAAATAAAVTAAARRAKEDVVAAQAREAEAAVAAAAREAVKANADADSDAAATEIVESTATAEAARLAVEAEAAAAVAAAAAEAEAEAEAEAKAAAAADVEHQAKLAAWEAAVATVRAVAQGGGNAQGIAAAAVAQLQVGAPEVRPHAATVAIRSDEQPGSLLVLASTTDGLVGEIWGDGDAEGAAGGDAGGDAEGAAEGAARCAALALLAGGDVTAAGGTAVGGTAPGGAAAGGGPAAVALREARDGYIFGALLSGPPTGHPGVPPEFLAMMAAALSECIERAWRRARLDALLEVAKEWVSDVCEGDKRLAAVEWVPDEAGAAASSIDLKGGAALVLTDKGPASPPGGALGTIVATCKEGAELNGYIVDLLEVS